MSLESATQWQNNKIAFQELSEKLCHLNTEQTTELVGLLSNFPSVFGDAPGKTALTFHDIDVGDSLPVKLPPPDHDPNPKKHLTGQSND